jgi:hypothetical protein
VKVGSIGIFMQHFIDPESAGISMCLVIGRELLTRSDSDGLEDLTLKMLPKP